MTFHGSIFIYKISYIILKLKNNNFFEIILINNAFILSKDLIIENFSLLLFSFQYFAPKWIFIFLVSLFSLLNNKFFSLKFIVGVILNTLKIIVICYEKKYSK